MWHFIILHLTCSIKTWKFPKKGHNEREIQTVNGTKSNSSRFWEENEGDKIYVELFCVEFFKKKFFVYVMWWEGIFFKKNLCSRTIIWYFVRLSLY